MTAASGSKAAGLKKAVATASSSNAMMSGKKTSMVKPLENPRTTFELLRAQLGEVKKQLTPYDWTNHISDYSDQKKAQQRLKTLADAADSGPLKDDPADENSPEWTERWETLMLSEHLKKKCMHAHSVFNSASQLLSQCHSCMAKDFFLAKLFIEAITHIPDNTSDEFELLQIKCKRMKVEGEELQDAYDKLVRAAKHKKEATLEGLSKRFDEERLSRFCGGVVSSWGFQAQREQVLRLRDEKQILEKKLEGVSAQLMATQHELEQKTADWAKEKTELTTELDKLRELHRKQQEETEKALKEASDASGRAQDKEAMLVKLSKEKVLFQAKIEELTGRVADLEKALAERTATANQLQEDLGKSQNELEVLQSSVAAVEATLEETRRTVRAQEGDMAILQEKLRKTTLDFQRQFAELESKALDAAAAQQEAEAHVQQCKDEIKETTERFEARIVELQEEMSKQQHDAEVRIAQVVSDADQTIANERERIEAEFRTKQEQLIASLINPNAPVGGASMEFACHMCQKWKQKAEELQREIKVRDGGTAPHLKGPDSLPVEKAQSVCLHCRQFVMYNQPLELRKSNNESSPSDHPPRKEEGATHSPRNRERGVALPHLGNPRGNRRVDPNHLRRTHSTNDWSHQDGQNLRTKPAHKNKRRAMPPAEFNRTLPVPDGYTFIRQEGIRREMLGSFSEIWS
eukprot:gnl/MRDRNA2_/MRDRNA2_91136_c0_seq1.p1 gnl/MRDRNA2_/MRDRNA2_91136_c0~~gnl/MRDRNA2_/MRDRNA2_91136_c0_seq1.p1  ORF type:complete len:735 (+),score=169.19 gnl/MRDRNA2_/MRDRNA2_91136_c0_seq1:131-2206(+)